MLCLMLLLSLETGTIPNANKEEWLIKKTLSS